MVCFYKCVFTSFVFIVFSFAFLYLLHTFYYAVCCYSSFFDYLLYTTCFIFESVFLVYAVFLIAFSLFNTPPYCLLYLFCYPSFFVILFFTKCVFL